MVINPHSLYLCEEEQRARTGKPYAQVCWPGGRKWPAVTKYALRLLVEVGGCGRVARVPELQGQVGQLFIAGRGKVGIDYHALDRIFPGRAQTSQISALIFHFYCFFPCIQQQIQPWNLFLAITDYNWVFSLTVCQFLLTWQSDSVGKKRKRVWMAAPLCLLWTLWNERNKAAFKNKTPSVHRMKSTFLFTL